MPEDTNDPLADLGEPPLALVEGGLEAFDAWCERLMAISEQTLLAYTSTTISDLIQSVAHLDAVQKNPGLLQNIACTPQVEGGRKGAELAWGPRRKEWPKWQKEVEEYVSNHPGHGAYSAACRHLANKYDVHPDTIRKRTTIP